MSFLLNQALHGQKPVDEDPSQSSVSVYNRREARAVPPASVMTYELPTPEQLRSSYVRIEYFPGVVKRIEPSARLFRPIEDYLPPSGAYFDHYALERIFNKDIFSRKDRCLSCWTRKHAETDQACQFSCLVCQTKDHLGAKCQALYVTMRFWEERGYTPPVSVQIHPSASELAYLVVAGIFKPAKRLWDPIIVNKEHPVVRQFYKDRDEPESLMRQKEVPRKKKVQAPLATVATNTTLRATVSEDTFTASIQLPQPQIQRTSNEIDLEKELKDKAAKIAYLEGNMAGTKEILDENARLKERIEKLEEKNTHLEHVQDQIRALLSSSSMEEDAPGEKRRRRFEDIRGRRG